MGRLGEATAVIGESVAHAGWTDGLALGGPLESLAGVHVDAGRHDEALRCLRQAQATGDRTARLLAMLTCTLGKVHIGRGEPSTAVPYLRQALEYSRASGYRYAEVQGLLAFSNAHVLLGQPGDARRHAGQALDLAVRCGHRVFEGRALSALAEVHLAEGDHPGAVTRCREALRVHGETGHRLGTARTLVTLGHALRPTDSVAAERHWAHALEIFTRAGAATEADQTRALLSGPRPEGSSAPPGGCGRR